MSLKDQLDKAFGKNKMYKVAVERLHPPIAPKPIVSETSVADTSLKSVSQRDEDLTDSTLSIDFSDMPEEYWDYCDTSDAKRAWKRAVLFKSARGTTLDIKREVKQTRQDLEIVNYMKKNKVLEYKECMKELELKLQEKRVE